MELRHIRYFVSVAEEQSFTRAAERLHVSQPPLSRQVRALELELGTDLLVRGPGRLELTPAGKLFYKEAVSILGHVSRAAATTRSIAAGHEGEIRVGYQSLVLHAPAVHRIFRKFRRDYSGVRLTFTLMTYQQQFDALRTNEIDVGLVHQGVMPDEIFASQVLSEEQIEFMFPKGHYLVEQQNLQLSDLRDQPFIMPKRAELPNLSDRMLAAWAARGLHPHIAAETDSFATTALLVGGGIGISYGDRQTAMQFSDTVQCAPALDFNFTWGGEVIWNENSESSQLRLLVPYIRER